MWLENSHSICFLSNVSNFNVLASNDKIIANWPLGALLAGLVPAAQFTSLPHVGPGWGMLLGGTCKDSRVFCLL